MIPTSLDPLDPLRRAAEAPLDLGPWRFAAPSWLWITLGAIALLTVILVVTHASRRRALARLGHLPQLQRMSESASPRRRAIKGVLMILAVLALGLALARPQLAGASRWRQRGVDLIVVSDMSKSMLAEDVRPSRLSRARLETNRLLDQLHGDRVGLVAFAGATVHYPLTTDYDAVRLLIDGLHPSELAPGSDVAGALTLAGCLLRPDLEKENDCKRGGRRRGHGGDPLSAAEAKRMQEQQLETTDLGERARVVVLITDGEQTEGDAIAAAAKLKERGISLYVLGVGTTGGAPVPEVDAAGQTRGWKNDDNGQPLVSKLDDEGLARLAGAGGDAERYLQLAPGQLGAAPLLRELARVRDGEVESRVVKSYNEAYQWVLYPGFLLLLIEALLGERRGGRRRRTS